MRKEDESSEPSTTSMEVPSSEEEEYDPVRGVEVEAAPQETTRRKGLKASCIIHMIFTDILVPLSMIATGLSTLGIIGVCILALLLLHVFFLNVTCGRLIGFQVISALELLVAACTCVFAILRFVQDDLLVNWFDILGFDFDNMVCSSPLFGIIAGGIAVFLILVQIAFSSKIEVKKLRQTRKSMFSSRHFNFWVEFLWYACLAYIGGASSSFLFAPILVFIIYATFSWTCGGRLRMQRIFFVLFHLYSLFYAGYILWQVSKVGNDYSIADATKWRYIAPENAGPVLPLMAFLFGYLSLELMGARKFNKKASFSRAGHFIAEILIILSFFGLFMFGLCYPCVLSLTWILIPIIASLFPLSPIIWGFFSVLLIVYMLTFAAIVVTSAHDFVSAPSQLVLDIGLFKFTGNFRFLTIGYFTWIVLMNLMKIRNSDTWVRQKKDEDKKQEEEDKDEFFEKPMSDEVSLSSTAKELIEASKKPTKKERLQSVLKKVKKFFMTVVVRVIKTFAQFVILAAIVVVGCTAAFYEDRWAMKVIFCLTLMIVLLSLYFQWLFIILKLLTGLLCLVNALFVSMKSQDWPSMIPYFYQTGLVPPNGTELIVFTWPYYTLFILLILITYKKEFVQSEFHPVIANFLFIIVAAMHLVYVFMYETNIFTFAYLMISLGILAFTILGNRAGLVWSTMISSVLVSVQLALLMLTHFNDIRNLLIAVLPSTTIFDMREIELPSEKVAMLSFILFATSVAFRSRPTPKKDEPTTQDFILKEVKYVFQNFFFYICWILVFGFSVANSYPTFLKFIISLFFIFGAASAKLVYKIRIIFMIFMVLFLAAQVLAHIFEYAMSQTVINYCRYLGLFLDSKSPLTNGARNTAIGWQFGIIMVCALNAKHDPPSAQDKKFERRLLMRLYNAFCALLHNWLPVIVQVSLCISCLFNPSLFGWISFTVLLIVCCKEMLLVRIALLVTVLFNICFIVQYLLWLGCPQFLFSFRVNGIINEWGKWIGIVDVSTIALITNCISAFIFTLFLQYHLMFVDYDTRFNDLPYILRSLLEIFVTYAYEIFATLIVIVSARIPSFDGFFFFVVVTVMFVASLLYEFPRRRTVRIIEMFIFFVLGAKIFSRIPVFSGKGLGEIAQHVFDLPLQASSAYEFLWIFAFALIRICVHLMDMELYHTRQEIKARVMAYRFLHNRQLALINQLDQEVIVARNQTMYKQISEMTAGDIETAVASLRDNSQATTLSRYETRSTGNLLGDKKPLWKRILPDILYYIVDHVITLLASAMPLISEAGQNFLTLETIQVLLRKNIRAEEAGQVLELDHKELEFFRNLPTAFKLQLDSVGEMSNFEYIPEKKRWAYLIRYLLHWVRRFSLTFLVLMVVIFVFMKPFIFAMILIIYVIAILCSSRLHNIPNVYRVLLIVVMVMNVFRSIAGTDVVREALLSASRSVALASMDLPILKLFGIDPNEGSAIESFLVIAAVWYVVEQLAYCEVFPNSYYYSKFKEFFPTFPDEFCYGIVNSPERVYALGVDPSESLLKQFTNSYKKQSLRDSVHRKLMLFVDIFSFLILVVCWNSWVTTTDGDITGTVEVKAIKVTVLFVFMMMIHIIWMFVCYWAQLANKYIVLFVAHNLWLIYSILMTFYYLGSKGGMDSSLKFYIVLRLLSHVIASHKCVKGGVLSSFVYPNFATHANLIIAKNKFMRMCPFAFEIQVLLEYISQETCVSLMDYFIISDIKSELEILIAEQTKPSHDDKYKRSNRYLKAGFGLLLILLLLFLPLFFMCEKDPEYHVNPIIGVNLEIGFNTFPPIWSGNAQIMSTSTSHIQSMIDSGLTEYQGFAKVDTQDLWLVNIPRASALTWTTDNSELYLDIFSSSADIIPYYRFTFYFTYPTGPGNSPTVTYTRASKPLTQAQKAQLVTGPLENLDWGLSLPMTIALEEGNDVIELPNAHRKILLTHINSATTPHWNIELPDVFAPIPFLNQGGGYRFILYSGKVDGQAEVASGSIGIGGIYILLLIVFGVVVRDKILGQAQDLWIERMERPVVLYRMFVSLDNVRANKEVEKEKDLADTLLDLLRSTETVIRTTAREKH